MTDVVAAPYERCSECGNTVLAQDAIRGELTCTACGLVLQDNQLDLGPEWHPFNPHAVKNHSDPTRTGDPITTLQLAFTSTEIANFTKMTTKYKVTSFQKTLFRRLKRLDHSIKLSVRTHANLRVAIAEICRLCSQLRVSRAVAAAAAMSYRKAMGQKLHRGYPILTVATAAVYMTVRQQKLLITLKDILQFAKMSKYDLSRCLWAFRWKLNAKPAPHNLIQFVQRLGSMLKLSCSTTRTAMTFIEQLRPHKFALGRKPAGVAAAAIYLAGVLTREHPTQDEIAQAAQVTTVTIRNQYKEIAETLGIDLANPREFALQRERWG